ncbi:MAG: hypothetical protein ABJ205_06825 [Erythrobacter sp.]|uniref:hypothetical protein n=1 Tax=Erythrobacter sp. TaxID=1042 RepID=UPI0032673828
MKTFKTMIAVTAMALALPMAAPAAAQEFPLEPGEYSEVSGIFVNDGAEFKYAQHLADQWVANLEFAKSNGWVSDYKIYVNVNPREGEPNIYLMTTFPRLLDAAEQERRNAAWTEFSKTNVQQQIAESGNRAEYRTVLSSMLLQEYTVRK